MKAHVDADKSAVSELAALLAAAYLRLIQADREKARNAAVSTPENLPNLLEIRAREWPAVTPEKTRVRAR